MKLHEYQAKSVLQQAGIPVPAGIPILDKDEIPAALKKLPPGPWVVKSQVHTGGRGKAGGILMTQTPAEVERAAIEVALRETRGNRRKAAEMLQIGERTLYRKLREYQVPVDDVALD